MAIAVPMTVFALGGAASASDSVGDVSVDADVAAPDEEDYFDLLPPVFLPDLLPGLVDPGMPSGIINDIAPDVVGDYDVNIGTCGGNASGPSRYGDIFLKGRGGAGCDSNQASISGKVCIQIQNGSTVWETMEDSCRPFSSAGEPSASKKTHTECRYGGWNYRMWVTYTIVGFNAETAAGTYTNGRHYLACHPLTTDPTGGGGTPNPEL